MCEINLQNIFKKINIIFYFLDQFMIYNIKHKSLSVFQELKHRQKQLEDELNLLKKTATKPENK